MRESTRLYNAHVLESLQTASAITPSAPLPLLNFTTTNALKLLLPWVTTVQIAPTHLARGHPSAATWRTIAITALECALPNLLLEAIATRPTLLVEIPLEQRHHLPASLATLTQAPAWWHRTWESLEIFVPTPANATATIAPVEFVLHFPKVPVAVEETVVMVLLVFLEFALPFPPLEVLALKAAGVNRMQHVL